MDLVSVVGIIEQEKSFALGEGLVKERLKLERIVGRMGMERREQPAHDSNGKERLTGRESRVRQIQVKTSSWKIRSNLLRQTVRND